jgi:alkylation response protein AidB-like acyl-CoA dehydrogenase
MSNVEVPASGLTRPRSLFSSDHEQFRATVRKFIAQEVLPEHALWEQEGNVPRELWRKAGQAGILCPMVPEAYGGAGADFLFTAIVVEEIARVLATGVTGWTTHSDIVAPYLVEFGTEEQKRHWLPAMARGDVVGAIGMTEPSAGSDLKAMRTVAQRVSGGYRVNGQKTFITNGLHADRLLLAAKTDPAAGVKGISLFWVDTRSEGFSRGRVLDKIGQRAQDTAELFFQDMFVPEGDMIGEPGKGFAYLMSGLVQERLMIALRCAISLEAALDWTVDYAKQRETFGKALIEHQALRFKLSEVKALALATRALVDGYLALHMQGQLSAEEAAVAKLWAADATRALDDLLQIFGGYGFMREYPIGRAYTDLRGNRIWGGSAEIMKELIARKL